MKGLFNVISYRLMSLEVFMFPETRKHKKKSTAETLISNGRVLYDIRNASAWALNAVYWL